MRDDKLLNYKEKYSNALDKKNISLHFKRYIGQSNVGQLSKKQPQKKMEKKLSDVGEQKSKLRESPISF